MVLVHYLFFAGVVATGTFMVALLAIGMFEIAAGIWTFAVASHGHGAAIECVRMSLKGLEFLFLAPLPFLTLTSLKRYIESSVGDAAPGVGDADFHALIGVKVMIASLMIALVATDLVGRAMAAGLVEDHQSFGYEVALSRCAVIIVLSAYVWLLERERRRGG